MGVPVAAYDIPGVDQLIEHNKTGLLAPLGDKEALEKCWLDLLWNLDHADEIADAAAHHINDKFSAKRMGIDGFPVRIVDAPADFFRAQNGDELDALRYAH